MTKIVRKKIKKKTSPPTPIVKMEEVVEEIIEETISETKWKESIGDGAKSKFCKPCIKRNSCVIGSLAMVMTCDKIETKKKRTKD